MPFIRCYIVLFLLLTGFSKNAQAQAYYLNGSAQALGADCYAITPADSWQNGSIWYARQLDLRNPINLEFTLNFGDNDEFGADGVVLVLQNAGTDALGINGSGIGFEGFNPALGIEFDVFQNGENNDPNYDHLAILSNGNVHHGRSGNLAGPVPVLSNSGNIEDGKDHRVRLQWDPYTQVLRISFDCVQRLSLKKDLVKDIFGGKPEVYWGFTGATGKYFNLFKACLDPDIIPRYRDTICPGESARLYGRPSAGNAWSWAPSTGLDSPFIQSPLASPDTSTRYVVSYTNQCNENITDTFEVIVTTPQGNPPGDTFFCEGSSYRLDAALFKADSIRWQDQGKELLRDLNDTGKWRFTWYQQSCAFDHQFLLEQKSAPLLHLNDTSICSGDRLSLTLDSLHGRFDTFFWNDGHTELSRDLTDPDQYILRLNHLCGNVSSAMNLSFWPADTFFLQAEDSVLCPGAELVISANPKPSGDLIWHDGQREDSILITSPGWFRAISQSQTHGCVFQDSIYISEGYFPEVRLEPEYILCTNEKLRIQPFSAHTQVYFWNNEPGPPEFELENYQGILTLKVRNQCGEDSATSEVSTIDCACQLWFPNAFTPNTDQLNDIFLPKGDCKILSFQWWIYNRWGELLYTSDHINKGWDGRVNGQEAPAGTYLYRAQYEGITNKGKERFQRSAIFHLLR